MNEEKEIEELRELFKQMQEIAKSRGSVLHWVEIKGTIYFYPQLPARDCQI